MAGILIIAHAPLATALRDCAAHVFSSLPVRVEAMDISADCDPAVVLEQARHILSGLIENNGAIVFTDLFGATPSNIAACLAEAGKIRVVAGVNLPMLMRTIGYRSEPLDMLVQKAVAGGTQGVVQVGASAPQNQSFPTDRHGTSRHDHSQ